MVSVYWRIREKDGGIASAIIMVKKKTKKKNSNECKSIRAWSTIDLKGLIPENIQ